MSQEANTKDPRSVFDVVIVGAGISGINTAYRVQTELPSTKYVLFEARDAIGGTWDFFRYPGLRSDSDLYTFGFSWRPWAKQNPIADAQSILEYLKASVAAEGIDMHVKLNSRVQSAEWSSKAQSWRLNVFLNGRLAVVETKFLVLGTGYYDYEEPLPGLIPNLDSFSGPVAHTQFWPKELDHGGKHVVCIGSGATAITLVPALAHKAASVTMLQRSPSYILSLPNSTASGMLQRHLPVQLMYTLNRLYFMIAPMLFYYFCRLFPTTARNMIRDGARKQLPSGYPVDPDFTPRYNPFDQRVCFAPDGDFYAAIRGGRVRVITDVIERVNSHSILLKSGLEVDADIIVTATGLKLELGGKVDLTVDGKKYGINEKFAWNHAMLQDLPNTMLIMGYTMSSWTLGADASAFLLCRLLKGLRRHNLTSIVPRIPKHEDMTPRPLMALSSTYVAAAANVLPKTGDKYPWTRRMNYLTDYFKVRYGDVTTGLEVHVGDVTVTGVRF